MAKKATLVEIARLSGVTPSTVSQVLTGNYGRNFSVRPHVRDKIIQVAAELKYRPNLAARSLSQHRTNLVSIVGSRYLIVAMEFYRSEFTEIQLAMTREKLDLLVTVPHESQLSELPPWRIDGAIVVQDCQERTVAELNENNCPYVMLNGLIDDNVPAVVADDRNGFHLAMDHLYGLGHRRIAYFQSKNPVDPIHYSFVLRHDSYLSEMAARGLTPISAHEQMTISPGAFLKGAMQEDATAVVTYSHLEAMALQQAAAVMGVSIPSELSVICFNDVYPCSYLNPPLTAIGFCLPDMGRAAAEMLLRMLKGQPIESKCVRIKEELVVRGSTAAPPA